MTGEKLGWRGRLLRRKLAGQLDGVSWLALGRHVLPARMGGRSGAGPVLPDAPTPAAYVLADGIETFATGWGPFSIPAPGAGVLAGLLGEVMLADAYANDAVGVRPGDVVLDCGAHVGVFSRHALARGAGRVIALELDGANLRCLEANLASHGDRAVCRAAALWSKPAIVQRTRARDSDCHAVHAPDGSDGESLRATTIDRVIAELAPARLDFLKMDLEGAEAEALAGALATLRRYRPRLAIATYHDAREESGIRALLRAHGVAYDFSYRWLVADAPFVLFGRPHNGA